MLAKEETVPLNCKHLNRHYHLTISRVSVYWKYLDTKTDYERYQALCVKRRARRTRTVTRHVYP